MPDDCPVNDEARRALRDLARRAEWRGQPGAAGAAADARTLRELGQQLQSALARDPDPDPSTWAYRASESLAAYCVRAKPDWTVEQIAELGRLREDAMTALAPGPGELQADPEPKPAPSPVLAALGIRPRRPAFLALAIVSCLVLIALVLTLPHLLSGNSSQAPAASATTTIPAAPTTQVPTASATDSGTATSSTSSASAGAPTTAASTSSADNSTVTAIQINNTDPLSGNPPEVIVTYTVAASGTGDITINLTVTGGSGQPQTMQQTESDQTSYSDLTQTIDLSQWCGQSSVLLTVSSGAVSQSATVPISGC